MNIGSSMLRFPAEHGGALFLLKHIEKIVVFSYNSN